MAEYGRYVLRDDYIGQAEHRHFQPERGEGSALDLEGSRFHRVSVRSNRLERRDLGSFMVRFARLDRSHLRSPGYMRGDAGHQENRGRLA